jgi:hypothetical protein
MEDIKKLTIQSVEVVKQGSKRDGSPYTLYRAKTDDGSYSFFDMPLQAGETATFKVKIEPSDRTNPKTGEAYMNRTIVGYTGSIDNLPAKPYRAATAGTAVPGTQPGVLPPNTDRFARLEGALQKANADLLDLAQVVSGLLSRVEALETPAFDQINVKLTEQDADDMPTF